MLIAAAIVWSLAAFGGAYAWTLPPIDVLVAVAAILAAPSIARSPDRFLDISLAVALGAAALQLVPLAPAVRGFLSPHAADLDAALRFGAAARAAEWHPLSIDPAATLTWLPSGAAAVVLFWTSRGVLSASGVRRMARTIAWIGLLVGPLVIVQAYSSPYLIYWTFRPLDMGARTAGPFVNRNHMATWLLLALPTTVGYLVARAIARWSDDDLTGAARTFEDPRTWWLLAASAAMLAALITSQSRAGLIGLMAAAATGLLLARRAGRTVSRRWLRAGVLAVVLVGAALANTGQLLSRFERTGADRVGGRLAIWRETIHITRDFAWSGTGIGAYETAMLVYQQQGRYRFFYNQAHNQYLQFAAEGGLLVGIPILLVVVAFASTAARRMRRDHSPMFWVRAGACSSIVGVAVQSLWETGLRMPANALLCAVVAALAVHDHHRQR